MLMVDRKEDMSPDGFLRLIMEDDGDIIVSVASGDPNGGLRHFADVQFCTSFGGGGASPKTHKALQALMIALAEDNRDAAAHRLKEFAGKDVLEYTKQWGTTPTKIVLDEF